MSVPQLTLHISVLTILPTATVIAATTDPMRWWNWAVFVLGTICAAWGIASEITSTEGKHD